ASALLGQTDRVIYLNDGEVGLVTQSGVKLQDLRARPINRKIEKLELSLEAIQKKGYKHFLLKEIHEQPETLRSTLSGRLNAKENLVNLGGPGLSQRELARIQHILIVGCGTAYYAGLLASYYLEQFLPSATTQVEIASELRYKAFNLPANTVALIVSQSGETADTRACLTELKRRGVTCLGVVNAVGSTIARECSRGIYLHVGAEISVASTKAFTSQVAAMLLFGLTIAQAKGVGRSRLASYISELDKLPHAIENVINGREDEIKRLAKSYQKYQHAIYLGRDTYYPIALEGALKLKEISYVNAQGYAAGELKHGPIALIDDKFFVLVMLPNNW
ncbi:MAG: SIS domain-containing protein, partial [Candidatus Saccharimonadales bacterium]